MSNYITIKLELTDEEWAELANAIDSKIRLIERGDYGGGEEADGEDEQWITTLNRILDAVTDELDERDIPW